MSSHQTFFVEDFVERFLGSYSNNAGASDGVSAALILACASLGHQRDERVPLASPRTRSPLLCLSLILCSGCLFGAPSVRGKLFKLGVWLFSVLALWSSRHIVWLLAGRFLQFRSNMGQVMKWQ